MAVLFAAAACTDFDTEGGTAASNPFVTARSGSFSQPEQDAGATDGGASSEDTGSPIVGVDTQGRSGGVDSGPTDTGKTDTGAADTGAPDAGPKDVGVADAGPADAGTADTGVFDAGSPDTGSEDAGKTDTGVKGLPDIPVGDPSSCAGRCGVYAAGASCQCDKGCVAFGDCCNDYESLCKKPDAGPAPDTATPDAGATDTSVMDAGSDDAGPVEDTGGDPEDTAVQPEDAGPPDTGIPDTGPTDTEPADTGPADIIADAGVDPAPDTVADSGADTASDTGTIADAVVDTVADTAKDTATVDVGDAAWYPDWQGYPDANYPDGADIFGGVINSCFSLYLYTVDESCTGNDLTKQCIDNSAKEGSLFAQFQFAPVRDCLKINCIDTCKNSSNSKKCFDQCLGKKCAYPFFACITAGQSGNNDCKTTLQCLDDPKYKDKIITIAKNCFGTAKSSAQKQVADFFSCGEQPQTSSCFNEVKACYGNGGGGTATCGDTLNCIGVCDQQNKGEQCSFDCIGKAKTTSVNKLDSLWMCIEDKCNGKWEASCILGSGPCNAEYSACTGDK